MFVCVCDGLEWVWGSECLCVLHLGVFGLSECVFVCVCEGQFGVGLGKCVCVCVWDSLECVWVE